MAQGATKKKEVRKPQEGREMIAVTFKANPAEIQKWKDAATAENRTLSNWLRLRLMAVRTSEEKA